MVEVFLAAGLVVMFLIMLMGLVCSINRHWFERTPPERKLFLKMLEELAKEDWCWEFGKATSAGGMMFSRTGTHTDSGLTITRTVIGLVYSSTTYEVRVNGEAVKFDKGRGYRICQRIFAIAARADHTASLKARKERDLKRLAAMSAAFDRMNAKDLHR